MRVRYVGSDDARDLALPGGFITFERSKWVNVEKACDDAGISVHHLEIVTFGPDWETETKAPAKEKP